MIIKPSNRLGEIKPYYFATKLAEIESMRSQGRDIINLGIGSPDLKPPSRALKALHDSSLLPDANKYQSYRGTPELREAFAKHYALNFDVNLDPANEVLPLIGSKEGIMHISMSFLNPGDQVLVPNPGYPSYRVTASISGAQPVFYNLSADKDWLPDLEKLSEKDLSKVKIMWINYPHMPTGSKANLSDFQSMVDFALKHEILLCHDNPYNFILNDRPLSIFQIPDAKLCSLELTSLSKGHNMAGWRVGCLAGRSDLVDIVMRFKSNMDSGMYKGIQHAAVAALKEGADWYNDLNRVYLQRREIVWQIFDRLDCTYTKDSAGLFVWAKTPEYITDVKEWIDDILHKAGVFITPGFIFGTQGERYVRIALCSPVEDYKKAMQKIETHITQPITTTL